MEARRRRVVWCAVGPAEQRKCQEWSSQSPEVVACATAATTEDCIALILVGRRGGSMCARSGQWAPQKTPVVGVCSEVRSPKRHFHGAGRASPRKVSSPALRPSAGWGLPPCRV